MGVLNFQLNSIPDVCTPDAPMRLTCPGVNTFFTAAVFWVSLPTCLIVLLATTTAQTLTYRARLDPTRCLAPTANTP